LFKNSLLPPKFTYNKKILKLLPSFSHRECKAQEKRSKTNKCGFTLVKSFSENFLEKLDKI
jgi:hypothetical protein